MSVPDETPILTGLRVRRARVRRPGWIPRIVEGCRDDGGDCAPCEPVPPPPPPPYVVVRDIPAINCFGGELFPRTLWVRVYNQANGAKSGGTLNGCAVEWDRAFRIESAGGPIWDGTTCGDGTWQQFTAGFDPCGGQPCAARFSFTMRNLSGTQADNPACVAIGGMLRSGGGSEIINSSASSEAGLQAGSTRNPFRIVLRYLNDTVSNAGLYHISELPTDELFASTSNLVTPCGSAPSDLVLTVSKVMGSGFVGEPAEGSYPLVRGFNGSYGWRYWDVGGDKYFDMSCLFGESWAVRCKWGPIDTVMPMSRQPTGSNNQAMELLSSSQSPFSAVFRYRMTNVLGNPADDDVYTFTVTE